MRGDRLGEAYHIERAVAAQQGIARYPCGCQKCHGFKTQTIQVVQSHHRKYGRDRKLQEPLLVWVIENLSCAICALASLTYIFKFLSLYCNWILNSLECGRKQNI